MSREIGIREIHFVSNNLGAFYQSVLRFFTDSFYPRFKVGIITTYDNAIQELKQYYENKGQETYGIPVPSVTLDPAGDLEPDDKTNYLWRYPQLTGGQGSLMYEPIYADEYVKITPVYNRFIGTFNVIMFCSSWYEAEDLKIKAIEFFGNKNRVCRPQFVRTYLHVPEDIVLYKYKNDVMGIDQDLDWSQTMLKYQLFKHIGKNEFLYPMTLNPWIKMTSISNNSGKYGSADNIPEFRVEISFEFEIDFPVFLVLDIDYKTDWSNCNIYVSGEFWPREAEAKIERSRCCIGKKDYFRSDYMGYVAEETAESISVDLDYEPTADMEVEIWEGTTRLNKEGDWTIHGKTLTLYHVTKNNIYHIIIWQEE